MTPASEGKRSASGKHPVLSFRNYSGQPLRFGAALFHPGVLTNKPLFLSVFTALVLQAGRHLCPFPESHFQDRALERGRARRGPCPLLNRLFCRGDGKTGQENAGKGNIKEKTA